jgi:hypothetical protein
MVRRSTTSDSHGRTTYVPLIRGHRLNEAHASHIYQRPGRYWGSHRAVTTLCWAVNLVWSLP